MKLHKNYISFLIYPTLIFSLGSLGLAVAPDQEKESGVSSVQETVSPTTKEFSLAALPEEESLAQEDNADKNVLPSYSEYTSEDFVKKSWEASH